MDQGTTTGNCYSTKASECDDFKTFVPGQVCGGQQCCTNSTKSSYPECTSAEGSTDPTCTCEISARPCCMGIAGECEIVSEQHCSFVEGTFHPEAELCSQVTCLEDACGLVDFLDDSQPDQWYRTILALFLHMGVIHLFVVILVQHSIAVDIEKLCGWLRMAFIYLISGIGGYFTSALMTPYQVTTGASPALYGLLGCLFIELMQSWHLLGSPWFELVKLTTTVLLGAGVGILPYVDNWAHSESADGG